MDLTGYAGTLKGTPNSSSALFQFPIKARLESGVPSEKMPAGRQLMKTLRTSQLHFASFAVRITAEGAEIKTQNAQRGEIVYFLISMPT